MSIIYLETKIKSKIEICFDLLRSIDLHQVSTSKTNERPIDSRTASLINLNEFETWQAKHFGVTQKLTSKITAFNRPFHFRDEQQKGVFKYIVHGHYFELDNDYVIMKDIFNFQSLYGIIGQLIDKTILRKYLKTLLPERNNVIEEYAETEKWKSLFNLDNLKS